MLRAQPNATKRLPSFCMFHYNMRVRLATTLAAPIAVQDVAGTVVGVELSPLDKYYYDVQSERQLEGEMVLSQMPLAIYVKLDNCSHQFLPEGDHPGIFAVRPKRYTWKYFLDSKSGDFINVSRRQFALLPATACTLYSMQGTTAEPGLVAYWQAPRRAEHAPPWLGTLCPTLLGSRPHAVSQNGGQLPQMQKAAGKAKAKTKAKGKTRERPG